MNGSTDTDRFTTDKDPAKAGEDLEICFDNPALQGDVIPVEISNGDGISETVNITLDADGHGCVTWKVPATGWLIINLNAQTSLEHSLHVVPQGGGG